MELISWVKAHAVDLLQLLQTIAIVGGLLFTAYLARKDERARQISNSISINAQHREVWKELFDHPELARTLSENVDPEKEPISVQEETFVSMLILQLVTSYRAMRYGEYVTLKGLRRDVAEFFSLPIPNVVWQKVKTLQDDDFVEFVEGCLK